MDTKTRREFLSRVGSLIGTGCIIGCGGTALLRPASVSAAGGNLDACFDGQCGRMIFGEKLPFDRLAKYWSALDKSRIQCTLCPYNCILKDGERCRCNAKENHGGKLYDMVYGYIATMHIDSVEKLPIYHRFPGMKTLTLGTAGCAFSCKYCQNWQLSQAPPERVENYRLMPEDIIELAQLHQVDALALAYTEPLTFFEYSYDLARMAKRAGLKVFMGTGGFANPEPVLDIAPYLDGVAFGLKGFSDEFYQDVIGQAVTLDQVLASLEAFKSGGAHLEIANLIVPTKNDSSEDVLRLSAWIGRNLGTDTPLHFLKFFPHFQYKQIPASTQSTMERAATAARNTGMQHVYLGNLPGHSANNSYCADCGALVVQRIGFRVLAVNLDEAGRCDACGARHSGNYSPHFITE